MFDSFYNLIYNAVFQGATNITPELASEITCWFSSAGCLLCIALPFALVWGIIRMIGRIG